MKGREKNNVKNVSHSLLPSSPSSDVLPLAPAAIGGLAIFDGLKLPNI